MFNVDGSAFCIRCLGPLVAASHRSFSVLKNAICNGARISAIGFCRLLLTNREPGGANVHVLPVEMHSDDKKLVKCLIPLSPANQIPSLRLDSFPWTTDPRVTRHSAFYHATCRISRRARWWQ